MTKIGFGINETKKKKNLHGEICIHITLVAPKTYTQHTHTIADINTENERS